MSGARHQTWPIDPDRRAKLDEELDRLGIDRSEIDEKLDRGETHIHIEHDSPS